MPRNAPRLFAILLATVVVGRLAIAFVVGSPLTTAVAWSALFGVLSLGALCGKRSAATAFAYLGIALGVDTLLQLLTVDVPRKHLIAALLWASLVMGTGAYILRSTAVKRFYAPKAKS